MKGNYILDSHAEGEAVKGATLFSGIGAPEHAASGIDWRWAAEIDKFACSVHAARFPGIPNLGDVTRIDPDAVEPVDLIVFGSPCQDFSIAGQRRGMDGERGNLSLVALALVAKLRPRWLVFENVPGLLSNWSGEAPSDLAEGAEREADQYSDIAAFLGMVRECGYLGCWRVFDAQFAGVPQRRRRIFFVGYLGDWRPAAAVLFERESLRGNPPPSREPRQGIAAPIAGCPEGGSGWRADADTADNLIANTLSAARGRACGHGADLETYIAFSGESDGSSARNPTTVSRPITGRHGDPGYVAAFGGNNTAGPIEVSTACNAHAGPHGRIDFETETFVTHSLRADGFDAVRRLTPRECERLQGFPDGWTALSGAADGPRYRALGNSMAVPVVRWVLNRIETFG